LEEDLRVEIQYSFEIAAEDLEYQAQAIEEASKTKDPKA
jgi:hypothetical protein